MGRLYGYLSLALVASVSVIGLPQTDFAWWKLPLFVTNFMALPWWIAETIKSIKLLKVQ